MAERLSTLTHDVGEAELDARRKTAGARPWHLWALGLLAFAWSAIGAVSFVLTQLDVEPVMSRFSPEQREYFASFPLWADVSWALAVLCGIVGCLQLLRARRLAFPFLLTSVIATIVFNLGGFLFLDGLNAMGTITELGLTVVPITFAAGLATYALAMQMRGVLQ